MHKNPFSLRRIAGKVHLWLGFASGLIVFILGITGCLYVFADEMKTYFYKNHFFVEAGHRKPVALVQSLANAQRAIGENRPISRIEISENPDRTYIFRSTKTDPQGFSHWNYYTYFKKVYINPYTGAIVKVEDTKGEFFHLVYSLHTNLLLGRKVGRPLIGYAVLVFVISLISGIVLWWPKKWRPHLLRSRLGIAWSSSSKRINYDLHSTLGFYASFWLLMAALTGLFWSFNWFESSVKFLVNGGPVIEQKDPKPVVSIKEVAINAIFRQLQADSPGAMGYVINLPSGHKTNVETSAYMHKHARFKRIQRKFSADGKIISSKTFADLSGAEKIGLLNYDLHVGSALGMTGKILAFAASLICATLPVTGFLIWYNRKYKKVPVRSGSAGYQNRLYRQKIPER